MNKEIEDTTAQLDMGRRKSNTERSRDALEMLSDRKSVLENHQQEVEQFLNNIFKGILGFNFKNYFLLIFLKIKENICTIRGQNSGRCISYYDLRFNNPTKTDIFIMRYRDVCPEIRVICIDEISVWMRTFPKVFLSDQYLKYVGWLLNDKAKEVRKSCLCWDFSFY